MSAIINQLHDIENNEVFPMTASGAVLTGQNRTLNDDLGNIDSRLSALEGNIKQWEYHAGNVEVADDGQWRLNTIYTEQQNVDGSIVPPVPLGSTILSASIVRYGGYKSALTASVNPATGIFVIHGIPSAKLKTILGTSSSSDYTAKDLIIQVHYLAN